MTPLQFVNNKTYVQQLDCLFLYYIDDQKLHHDETKLMSYDIGRINMNIKSTFGIHVTTSTYKAGTPAVYGMYITNTNSFKMSKKDMKHVFRHKITRQTRISQYQCMEMKNSRDFLCFNSCTIVLEGNIITKTKIT